MSENVQISAEGKLMQVHVTGKLTRDTYAELVPAVEAQIEKCGKLRLLFVMHDFHGWTAGAMWEDLKFDLKHWKDIERLAMVGETKWQKGMAAFCRPFTKATIQYFDQSDLDKAKQWLEGDADAS